MGRAITSEPSSAGGEVEDGDDDDDDDADGGRVAAFAVAAFDVAEDDEAGELVGGDDDGELFAVEAADAEGAGAVGATRSRVSCSGAGLLSASVPMAKPTARHRSMLSSAARKAKSLVRHES